MKGRLLIVACFAALSMQTGCGNKIECGAGTRESNDRCVAVESENDMCGPGTEEVDGECVVSDEPVTCGTGTMLDANSGVCVATGTTSCGANTAFDETADACIPTDTVCAAGTTFDPALAVCMPDVACAAGDVVIDGICVPPFEELWEAVTVMSVENDDPFFGGAATAITLEAEGTSLVLGGTIAAATDLDGDGLADADREVFEFTTAGPEWLTIAVQSESEALVGFFVVNEQETWGRTSPFVGATGNAREVLIPAAGTYRLVVLPGFLGHGDETRWVATVQDDPMPSPIAHTFGNSISGNFDNPETGLLTANLSGAGTLFVEQWPMEAQADVMVFDGTEWVAAATLTSGGPAAALVGAGDTTFFIDPLAYGIRLERDYVVGTAISASHDFGTITPGPTLASPQLPLDAAGTIFTVDVAPGQVLVLRADASVEYELLTPYRAFASLVPQQPETIAVLAGGTVSFRMSSVGPPQPTVVAVTAYQPTPVSVAAQGTLVESVGDLTTAAFYLVDFAAGDRGRLQQANASGVAIEVGWWDETWTIPQYSPLEEIGTSFGMRTLSFATVASPQLVELRPFVGSATQLEMTFAGVGTTSLGTVGVGGNLSVVDAAARAPGETSYYSFTLSEEALAIGTVDAGADVDARILDSSGNPAWEGLTGGGENVSALLAAGDYTLEVIPFQALPSGFTVDIDLVMLPSTTELEPNNTFATATPGLAIGNDVRGTASGDEDWFSFAVTTSGQYSIVASPITSPPPFLDLVVADAGGAVLAAANFPDRNEFTGFLEPGMYTLRVTGGGAGEVYLVRATTTTTGADVDDAGGNDASTSAQALAAIPASIAGVLLPGDEDWYTFTLASPTDVFVSATATGGESRVANIEVLDAALAVVAPSGLIYSLAAGVHYIRAFDGGSATGFPDYLVRVGVVPGTSYSSAPALAIPDNALLMPVSDTLTVPSACIITELLVQIDVTHTYIGDLEVRLASPTGTNLVLWFRTGGGADDLVGTFGLDLASASPLTSVLGEEAMGTWTITIGDGAPSDTGTLNSWGILVGCQ